MSAVPEFDPLTDPLPPDFYSGGQRAPREVGPDSWLASAAAGVAAVRARSTGPDVIAASGSTASSALPKPVAVPEWDPLSDPWPGEELEPTALEAVVREEVDPLGLAYPTWLGSTTGVPATAQDPVLAEQPAPEAETAEMDALSAEVEHALLQTQPYDLWNEHPSGPLPQAGALPPDLIVPESPAELMTPPATARATLAYDLTLNGPLGGPEFGFAEGRWLSITETGTRPVSVSTVLHAHPEKAGQITQLACWWLRENSKRERAIDLATELSLAVSDLARRARG
ncbi:MAG: hypothetical protein ACT4PP_11410 [Sporichthyaceae bacterium]